MKTIIIIVSYVQQSMMLARSPSLWSPVPFVFVQRCCLPPSVHSGSLPTTAAVTNLKTSAVSGGAPYHTADRP